MCRSDAGRGAVLDLELFEYPSFTWGSLAAAVMTAGVFSLLLMVPLYAQYVLDYDPLGSGFTLMTLGIGMAFGGPVIARLHRWSRRATILITLIIQPIAILALIPFITVNGEGWWLASALFIEGFAWGAAYSILVSLLLEDIPKVY